MADYGAVGLGIILVFLLAVFWQLVRRIRTGGSDAKGAGDWRRTLWAWLGLAALAAMAMHSLFDFNLHIPACAVAFFMVLGIALQRPRREWRSARWFANPAIFVVLVPPFLAGVLLWQASVIVLTQRALPPGDREIKEMSADEIEKLGERLLARDPKAYPLLTKVGDAFRVRAAEKRENLGRRALPREERQELLREQHRLANQALRYYQAAHSAAPLNDALLARQALVLDLMRRHEEAYLAYQEALRNQPLNRYFHLALGFHFVESAQWQEALDAFQRASQIQQGPRESPEILQQARAAAQFVRERMQRDN